MESLIMDWLSSSTSMRSPSVPASCRTLPSEPPSAAASSAASSRTSSLEKW
jgi:hypothetical protein